jgi:hypothetical protein
VTDEQDQAILSNWNPGGNVEVTNIIDPQTEWGIKQGADRWATIREERAVATAKLRASMLRLILF